MSPPDRRLHELAARAALLCSGSLIFACEFPNYAFQTGSADANAGSASDRGGASMADEAGAPPIGGAGAATSGGAGGKSGGSAGSGESGGSLTNGGSGTGGAAGEAGGNGGNAGNAGNAGGLLFSDDFESGHATSWTPSATGQWSVVVSGTNHVYKQGAKIDGLCVSSAGASAWTDQVLEAKIQVLTFGGSTTSDLALLATRFRDGDNFYYAALRSDGKIVLKARLNGSDGSLAASVSTGIKTGTWYDVKLSAIGEDLSVYVNGALVQKVSGVLIASGAIAFGTNNATATFDDVTVTAP